MPEEYFSDRERGSSPRVEQELTPATWAAILALVRSRIGTGWFGIDYPEQCDDGRGITGTNANAFWATARGEIPDLPQPLSDTEPLPTLAALDLLEFCHRHIGEPEELGYHSYFSHHHLRFDRSSGQALFREDVERILSRNGLAYELRDSGRVERLAPVVLREALQTAAFLTGDTTLDDMLDAARARFLDPRPTVRREALEKLWDAWERVKTLEDRDKRVGTEKILTLASPDAEFRTRLEADARGLTDIGNAFLIRHSETNRVPIALDEHVDYLFHRLFALIRLCLERRRQRS